ncbi:MAG: carbamoyltransferase HypF [Bryobacteraceae bacterium]
MTVAAPGVERRALRIAGAVQGVGFRPFVFRLACELGLHGFVRNEAGGVCVEAEGPPPLLDELERRIAADAPPVAHIHRVHAVAIPPRDDNAPFAIAPSVGDRRGPSALVPDQASCTECRDESLADSGRRAGYAFTACAACGPRYSISAAPVFDRAVTAMASFPLCPDCRREYDNPADRRFHAQTIACPRCGPHLLWRDAAGLEQTTNAIALAAQAIRNGAIVALQGIGGFQLLADACDGRAVARLRESKRREAKPFAVMYPSLAAIAGDCVVSNEEAALLADSAAPIVLLRRRDGCSLAAAVCRTSPYAGVLLPYSPLHWLLLRELDRPIVATSANRSGEPICVTAERTLDAFGDAIGGTLLHDRAIIRPCDDSLARVVSGRVTLLRRARGYAPLPVRLSRSCRPVLALGGHLKTAVAIAAGREVVLSPHIGDLDTVPMREAYRREVERLLHLSGSRPEAVGCDLHPDYYSTRFAPELGLPVVRVQHHEAHVAGCAAENGLDTPYLGVAWDGSGYGRDGTIWGGEFFLADGSRFQRFAHFRPFRLPGGEAAARDGRRCAASLLHQVGGLGLDAWLSERESIVFARQIERAFNAPWTTSAGRLFDAVAALSGIARQSAFEGEAAMMLEGSAAGRAGHPYPAPVEMRELLELDWRPMVDAIVRDVREGAPPNLVASRFHATLAHWIAALARHAGMPDVVLSGGVFQNADLTGRAKDALRGAGYRVWTHREVPPNDGGLALGQAVLAGWHDGMGA